MNTPSPSKGSEEASFGHASDCAVHRAPAYEPGPCDCGLEERLLAEIVSLQERVISANDRTIFANNHTVAARTRLAALEALLVEAGEVLTEFIEFRAPSLARAKALAARIAEMVETKS